MGSAGLPVAATAAAQSAMPNPSVMRPASTASRGSREALAGAHRRALARVSEEFAAAIRTAAATVAQ